MKEVSLKELEETMNWKVSHYLAQVAHYAEIHDPSEKDYEVNHMMKCIETLFELDFLDEEDFCVISNVLHGASIRIYKEIVGYFE